MKNGDTVYALMTAECHQDNIHLLAIVTSKKEVRQVCKEMGYTWNKDDKLFLETDGPHYIRVDSVVVGDPSGVKGRIDFSPKKKEVKEPPVEIPETLEAAFEWLSSLENLDEFKKHGPVAFHHGLGRWIRNNWGFWTKEGPLFAYFNGLGIDHADDMSSIILDSFHRQLTGKPIDIPGQVASYKKYWKNQETEEE